MELRDVKTAPGSTSLIVAPLVIGALLMSVLLLLGYAVWMQALMLVFGISGTVFLLIFFRDPDREIPEKGIVSPADGVVSIVDEPDGRKRVAVFMNVHNVHVNRAPFQGKVLSIRHIDGGYLPAYRKDSDRNERVYTELETDIGRFTIVQIAGALVRRIVTYANEGDIVDKGQRIGMIRFGSRVDTIMPGSVKVIVREGDGVKAGETVIALPTE